MHTPPHWIASPLPSAHGCQREIKASADGLSSCTGKGARRMDPAGCPSPPSELMLPGGTGAAGQSCEVLPFTTASASVMPTCRGKGWECTPVAGAERERQVERDRETGRERQREREREEGEPAKESSQTSYDFLQRCAKNPSHPLNSKGMVGDKIKFALCLHPMSHDCLTHQLHTLPPEESSRNTRHIAS